MMSILSTIESVPTPVHCTMLNVFSVTVELKTTSHIAPPPLPVVRSAMFNEFPSTISVEATASANVAKSRVNSVVLVTANCGTKSISKTAFANVLASASVALG